MLLAPYISVSYTRELHQRPSLLRLILDEGGFGEAVCQCGWRFAWDVATQENMIYDGDGRPRLFCPNCRAIE